MNILNQIEEINLNSLELKTFTEQDALDYCQLNNINPDNITELFLNNNKLTDISGIMVFKNIENLYLSYNKITDISVIQYLKKLCFLDMEYLELESEQIKYIKSLKNLKTLYCNKGFKNMSVLSELNNNIEIYE